MSSKFLNKKIDTPDGKFDSLKEYRRWTELKILRDAGQINNLQRQVKYPLMVNGRRVCSIVADFVYIEHGQEVVEDTKSDFTKKLPVWRLKSKLFAAIHGREIREV